LKNQINEKEESCHNLEVEVVDLRKKIEKSNNHIKFMNNSTILDEILDSQISPHDKSGLGYNNEANLEASTSKKHEVNPSFSKSGSNAEVNHTYTKQGNFQKNKARKTSRSHLYTSKKIQKRDSFKVDTKSKV
jgi:hypothetical protein